MLALPGDKGGVQRDGHRHWIRQRDPVLPGLLKVSVLSATVAFNGKARLWRPKTKDVLDVVRVQSGLAAAEMPAHEFNRKPAAQHDLGGFRVAPNVVLGGGSHVPFATRSAAHDH